MTEHRKYTHGFFIVLSFMAAALLFSRPAAADFEAYHLFGSGAVSQSMGGAPIGSDYDALDYLINPALIYRIDATRYTLGIGNWKEKETDFQYKYTLASYARKNKGFTLLLDDESGLSRDMFTYTTVLPFGKSESVRFGVNISGYRYSTPTVISRFGVEYPSENGSGFAVDLGMFKRYNSGIRAGVSIQNLLSTGSEMTTYTGARRDFQLPRVLNFGVSYPLRDNIDLYAGWKSYSIEEADNVFVDKTGGSMLYIGGEYRLPGKVSSLSGRGTFVRESQFTDYDDKSLMIGGTYQSPKYNFSVAAPNKHDTFTSGSSVSIAYKAQQDEVWKEPFVAPEQVKTEAPPVEEPPKVVYEEPLSAAEPVPVKEEAPLQQIKKQPDAAPELQLTRVASFKVDPKVIMVPAPAKRDTDAAAGNWAEKHVEALTTDGYYPNGKSAAFSPSAKTSREEFYRLIFLTQLMKVFDEPVIVTFNTPYPVSAEMWLLSPALSQPVLLQEGTYDRPGQKRLVVNRALLEEKEVYAGKYKLRLKTAGQDMSPEELEDYVTVLDTSMDFEAIAAKPPDEKRQQIKTFKNNMKDLGINLEYLDNLEKEGPMTRIEALESLLEAVGADLPADYEKDNIFTDLWSLAEDGQAAVFLASRGMPSLEGRALMWGYPDNTFRPNSEITGAEAAALVDRFRALAPDDFEPPYRVAIRPPAPVKPLAVATAQPKKAASTGAPKGAVKQPVKKTGATKGQSVIARLPEPPGVTGWLIEAGSYSERENADAAIINLRNYGHNPELTLENIGTAGIYHVSLGHYATREDASAMMARLAAVPDMDFNLSPIYSGESVAFAPSPEIPSRTIRPPAASRKDAEGEMKLEGASFVPWNLIRNLEDFTPRSGGLVGE